MHLHTDVTNVVGHLQYWCRWPAGGKFIEATEVAEKWPKMLLDFLEERIQYENPISGNIHQFKKKNDKAFQSFFVGQQMGKF